MSSDPTPSVDAPTSAPDAHLSVPCLAPEPAAMRSISANLRFWIVAACGLVIDLWSKHWAFHTLQQGGRMGLVPHVLEFQTMLNKGALFGIGAGQTELFLLASVLAIVLVFWMFAQSPKRRWWLHIALGAILAGALGNMYDRVFVRLVETPFEINGRIVFMEPCGERGGATLLREYPADENGRQQPLLSIPEQPRVVGFVRDFIKIPTKFWGNRDLWPWVFNVADMLLVGGVAILGLHLVRDRRLPVDEPCAAPETAPTVTADAVSTREASSETPGNPG